LGEGLGARLNPTSLPSPLKGRSRDNFQTKLAFEAQLIHQIEQKPTPCPLHLERGKRTRRSSVTIGRRTEPVEVVRSVTMQAWDRGKCWHALAKGTALPYNPLMEFIEATAFTKYLYDYLSEDE